MRKKSIFILTLSVLIFFQISLVTFARAGGGGGGGGSSSGGGGGGSSSSGSSSSSFDNGYIGNRYYSRNPKEDFLGSLLFFLFPLLFVGLSKKDEVLFRLEVLNKTKDTKRIIRRLKRLDSSYSDSNLQKRVEETYFKLQEAWTKMDVNISKEYMSDNIYNIHNTKLSWMRIKYKRNILENIQLISATPVSIKHYKDNSKDVVWFNIHGSMIDYIINVNTNDILEGSTKRKSFTEFWKFIKVEDKWVIDKILQTYEVNLELDFQNIFED